MRIWLFAIILLFSMAANAVSIDELNVDVSLNNDGTASWIVDISYNENITQSDYFLLSDIRNVNVLIGNRPVSCEVTEEEIGASIICTNIYADKITYKFLSFGMVNDIGRFLIFNYRLPITQLTDEAFVTVRLPLGTVLAEEARLAGTGLSPFEPEKGIEGSDGRRIFVSWVFADPDLGDNIDISIVYEIISAIDVSQLIVILILIAAVAIIAFLFLHSRRHKIRHVLPVLTEGERKVMEILLREKKEVDQRNIVKELDYSKSKVSRIIRDLEQRGLIDKRAKGRTNLVKLIHETRHVQKEEKK